MSKDLKELEGKIGYKFDDFTLFTKAMIHSSYANEKHLPKYECNERLEFLGDAVLEVVSSDFLFREHLLALQGAVRAVNSEYQGPSFNAIPPFLQPAYLTGSPLKRK